MRSFATLALLVAVLVAVVTSKNYYLDAASGNDANNGESNTAQWKTLAHALASIPSKNTLMVAAGTYASNEITVDGKSVDIGTDNSSVEVTFESTISTDSTKTFGLLLTGDQTTTITGIKFTAGNQAPDLRTENAGWGALVIHAQVTATLDHCTFTSMTGSNDNKRHVKAVDTAKDSVVVLSYCTFSDIIKGGAVSSLGKLTIGGSTFYNIRGLDGNLASAITSFGELDVSDSTITFTEQDVKSDSPISAVHLSGTSSSTLTGVTITGAQQPSSVNYGIINVEGIDGNFAAVLKDVHVKAPRIARDTTTTAARQPVVAVMLRGQGAIVADSCTFNSFPSAEYESYIFKGAATDPDVDKTLNVVVYNMGTSLSPISSSAIFMRFTRPSADVTVHDVYFHGEPTAASKKWPLVQIEAEKVILTNVVMSAQLSADRGGFLLSGSKEVDVESCKATNIPADKIGLEITGPQAAHGANSSSFNIKDYSYAGVGKGLVTESSVHLTVKNYKYTAQHGLNTPFYLADITGIASISDVLVTDTPSGLAAIRSTGGKVTISSSESCSLGMSSDTASCVADTGGDCSGSIKFGGLDVCGICGGDGKSCDGTSENVIPGPNSSNHLQNALAVNVLVVMCLGLTGALTFSGVFYYRNSHDGGYISSNGGESVPLKSGPDVDQLVDARL